MCPPTVAKREPPSQGWVWAEPPSCFTMAFQEAFFLFVYLPNLIKMNGNQPTIQGPTPLSRSRAKAIRDIRMGPSAGNYRVTFFLLCAA